MTGVTRDEGLWSHPCFQGIAVFSPSTCLCSLSIIGILEKQIAAPDQINQRVHSRLWPLIKNPRAPVPGPLHFQLVLRYRCRVTSLPSRVTGSIQPQGYWCRPSWDLTLTSIPPPLSLEPPTHKHAPLHTRTHTKRNSRPSLLAVSSVSILVLLRRAKWVKVLLEVLLQANRKIVHLRQKGGKKTGQETGKVFSEGADFLPTPGMNHFDHNQGWYSYCRTEMPFKGCSHLLVFYTPGSVIYTGVDSHGIKCPGG